jgi:hypothetical protein
VLEGTVDDVGSTVVDVPGRFTEVPEPHPTAETTTTTVAAQIAIRG